MINRLGDPEPLLAKGDALGERTRLGMARGEVGMGKHGGQDELTEALIAPLPVEGGYGQPEAVDRPTIVALGMVGSADVGVRQRQQANLSVGRGECKGALGSGDGLIMCAPVV